MPPQGTPGRRRPKNDTYVPYNARPKEVGTRTGKPMPQNVRLNEDGFEDPDDFFNSPETSKRGAARRESRRDLRRDSRRGDDSSPRPAVARKGRMSDLQIEEESDAYEAEDLLMDEDEMDRRTPPGPLNPSSPNPPPSVTLPRRSQYIPSPIGSSPLRRRSPNGRAESRRVSDQRSPIVHDGPHESQIPDISAEFNAVEGEGEEEIDMEVEMEMEETETSQPVRKRPSTSRKFKGPVATEEEEVAPDTYDEGHEDDPPEDPPEDVFMDQGEYDAQEPASDQYDDDAALEQQAVDDENEDDEEPLDLVMEQNLANVEKVRHARKTTKRATALADGDVPKTIKRSRVSQLPAEGDAEYQGDFTTRRSGRRHFRPLAWWRGERFEYARGDIAPIVEAVVHVPASQPVPRPKARRQGRRATSRAPSAARSRAGTVEEPEHDLDENTPTNHLILEYPSGQEVKRRVAMPRSKLELKAVLAGNFMYQKAFGEDKFIASGHLYLPPHGGKPSKSSRDNSYVFYVIEGAVKVTIHKSHFVVSTGGSFIVPRGNVYQIANVLESETKLFFAQSRKILASEEEEAAMAEITGAGIQSLGTQRDDDEEEEESDGESDESPPPVIHKGRGVAARAM